MDPHARFERLALSHVLGGLPRDDSSEFRTHLRACELCRARIAELRGISSALDAAARDERRRSDEPGTGRREHPVSVDPRRRSRVTGLLVALALAVASLGFWNLHLRTSSDAYFAIAEERAAILRDLAAGELLVAPAPATADARVAVNGGRVILVITDAGPLGSDERLVAWLLPVGSAAADRVVLAVGPRVDVEVAVRLVREAASELVVTRERGLLSSSGPRGAEVLRVRLP
jgi:anti-sigma factor RsiW